MIQLTTHRRAPVVPTQRPGRLGPALGILALLAVVLVSSLPTAAALPPSAAVAATPSAATPASVTFNPPCAPVVTGVCVSIANASEPDIVPAPGTFVSSVTPSSTVSLPLIVKSQGTLNGTTSSSPRSGPDAPVILNVTGNLWDGVPYYSTYDGSVYHSSTQQWWDGPLATTNTTYPYWYLVNISAIATSGQPDFFPGMNISWSIEITYNVSGNFIHENGPVFQFSYKGAWPWAPYAGAKKYAGAAAFAQDLTSTIIPSQPNWNDSLALSLNATPADKVANASIGSAYLDVSETAANGTFVAATTLTAITGTGPGQGVTKVNFTIPASFAQEANATVRYEFHASDVWGDWIASGPATYKVGGNGSFASGQFGNDLSLLTSPSVNLPTLLGPGTPVALHLTSTNARTAIASATVFYSVNVPLLKETSSYSSRLSRVNSTSFVGRLPGLPVGSGMNFTIEAWDFSSVGEISSDYNYSIAPLETVLPSIAENGTFFYVAVHDAGLNQWVTGAVVTVAGPAGYFRSVGTTLAGLDYPNETGGPFLPVVVPAGSTYIVNVADPTFRPNGTGSAVSVSVLVAATHLMGNHAILATGSTYSVVLDGNLVIFYLNSTAIAASSANPDSTSVVLASVLGLGAAALAFIPLFGWWKRIVKRREEETKRVTL
ncbi:MAG: hypothetical protein L3K10_02775 [Thermoplasmata archaeon]|nr:hypothetical protein [Thermoplasmata archaeon]